MGTFACRKARRKTKNKTKSSIARKLRNMLVHGRYQQLPISSAPAKVA
jgi:hypothetical protein